MNSERLGLKVSVLLAGVVLLAIYFHNRVATPLFTTVLRYLLGD